MVDVITAPDALVQHCRRAKRTEVRSGLIGSRDVGDVKSLVDWLNNKDEFGDHDSWVNLGMALRLEFGSAGLDLWRRAHDETVTEAVEASKWESFASEPKPGCYTLNSLFKRAHDLGWKGTVRPSIGSMFAGVAQLAISPSVVPDTVSLPPGVPGPSNPAAEENAANESAFPTPPGGFTKSLAQSLAGFSPPDYLIDRILQRRFCYSITAQTGVGKTTVAMRLAAHVAIGKKLGEIDVERGAVLYFAGENPEDVKMRWFGLTQEMGLDPNTLDIHIVEGAMHISKVADRITQEVHALGKPLALVVVDTAAAYFEEDNENDNVQAGNHARRLRSLCGLPGGPCVLVLCHPTKNATDDALVPRGGGAVLAEVDGNIALRRSGDTIVAHALGKFRGPEFSPINFGLKVIGNHPRLVDTKGRPIPTIVAVPISAAEQARQEEKASGDELKVLDIICNAPGINNANVTRKMGWNDHKKTARLLGKLAGQKLIEEPINGKGWLATSKAQKGLNIVTSAAAEPVRERAPIVAANLGGASFPTPTRPHNPPQMPPPPGS